MSEMLAMASVGGESPSTEVDDCLGKIFLGGLSWQTTQETLRFHFEKYGELSDVAIMTDKQTGQPRFISFTHVVCLCYCNIISF